MQLEKPLDDPEPALMQRIYKSRQSLGRHRAIEGIECSVPDGAFYAYADVSAHSSSSAEGSSAGSVHREENPSSYNIPYGNEGPEFQEKICFRRNIELQRANRPRLPLAVQSESAVRAVARVYGVNSPAPSHGTAMARSHGSQWVQSS